MAVLTSTFRLLCESLAEGRGPVLFVSRHPHLLSPTGQRGLFQISSLHLWAGASTSLPKDGTRVIGQAVIPKGK